MTQSKIIRSAGGTSFVGPDAVELFRLVGLAHGLKLYANCGIRPNRAWTPTAMLKAASQATGCHFRRGQYLIAAEVLLETVEKLRNRCEIIDETATR